MTTGSAVGPGSDGDSGGTAPPVLRVVRGRPTDEEVAALVVVLHNAGAPAGRTPELPSRSSWSAYWRSAKAPLLPSRDAWRASGQPR